MLDARAEWYTIGRRGTRTHDLIGPAVSRGARKEMQEAHLKAYSTLHEGLCVDT